MLRPLQMMCASAPLAKINSRLFGILHMEVYWWPFASYYFPTHQPTPPKGPANPNVSVIGRSDYICVPYQQINFCVTHIRTKKSEKYRTTSFFFHRKCHILARALHLNTSVWWSIQKTGRVGVPYMTKLLVVHLPPFHLRRNKEKEGNRWVL